MTQKPYLNYGQIWNLNFGYLGLQVCLSLIIANTSRVLSGFGADTNELAFLWLVAPLSGLILQPIIGHFSDRVWTFFGRRIPFIFVGVIITAIMMVFMPNSYIISRYIPPVIAGVSILFFMQGALNVAMQPYRSLVGDMVNEKQTNLGFSVQTLLTNIGGLIGSLLPFLLTLGGVANQSESNRDMVDTVKWSFYIGAVLLLLTNMWTCIKVKEYPPKQFGEYNGQDQNIASIENKVDKGKVKNVLFHLAIVQLFSWFAFYYIWVYTTDAIAYTVWNTNDPHSVEYNNAANLFGVLSGFYCVVAAVFSVFIPRLLEKIDRKLLFALALALGGISMLSIYYIHNQYLLMIPMIGIGIAWSMILTIPLAILSSLVPAGKMGLYMGLFNVTIVIPQIVAGLAGNFIFKHIAGGYALGMIVVAGLSLFAGAISVLLIKDK